MAGFTLNRRDLIRLASLGASALAIPACLRTTGQSGIARSFPLDQVQLKPSIQQDAFAANRQYLHELDPDRLLHNFLRNAGLTPKAPIYGGWESGGVSGHTLGHYLSACSMTYAQSGDAECYRRVRYIVAELQRCQEAHGDGYVGGGVLVRAGTTIDAKAVFEELRRGEIRSAQFELNDCWVPFYTWHKVHAGLLDAHRFVGDSAALEVVLGMCGYLGDIIDSLDDSQLQQVLITEYGGLNETFAETYARTGNRRWLDIAKRFYDHRVLDPLTAERDELDGLHGNTQIPKLIGLARLYDLTGERNYEIAAQFFWDAVTTSHSYVIGGNTEREHFGEPGRLDGTLTEQTCESCNSYNMLRLTRHLFAWRQHAAYFDYYERTHLNHIMGQQDPATGSFAYMMPLSPGAARRWSTPTESFWCCVGTGMESHAKHADSIWWESNGTVFLNLFIPSTLNWRERSVILDLDTRYPDEDIITVTIAKAGQLGPLAIRIPGWCSSPQLDVNGDRQQIVRTDGYAVVDRPWRDGDRVRLVLPMELEIEQLPGDPGMIAFVNGPLVLAADLGPTSEPVLGPSPALVAEDAARAIRPQGEIHHFVTAGTGRPGEMELRPYFRQYHRRTAVYLPFVTEQQWLGNVASFESRRLAEAALASRTIDVLYLGNMQSEREHDLETSHSEPNIYLGRTSRTIWPWGSISFVLAVEPGTMTLGVLQHGGSLNPDPQIFVDDIRINPLAAPSGGRPDFVEILYQLPEQVVEAKKRIHVRVVPRWKEWLSLYEFRITSASGTDTA